ncbi:MAG: ATP-binding protein [Proteobacteria bacterium]|nr:ATP-binding protein [Patescibacteria group bacterium]MBU1173060.1 ATP-binding protein [Pseudomonadota bacterium]
MLDLKNKSACLFGLPDSGKSTLANFIVTKYGRAAFVYDTLNEYPESPYDSYTPKDRNSVPELEGVVRAIMAGRRYRLLLIDEANRFCPSKPNPLPQAIADLNDYRAHYEMSTIYIARRPVQLNQDLTELANYLILFHLDGKNDRQYLNDISAGLGDIAATLKPFHFAVYHKGQGTQVYNPVKAIYTTAKIIKAAIT